jgi:hypothetical protein
MEPNGALMVKKKSRILARMGKEKAARDPHHEESGRLVGITRPSCIRMSLIESGPGSLLSPLAVLAARRGPGKMKKPRIPLPGLSVSCGFMFYRAVLNHVLISDIQLIYKPKTAKIGAS